MLACPLSLVVMVHLEKSWIWNMFDRWPGWVCEQFRRPKTKSVNSHYQLFCAEEHFENGRCTCRGIKEFVRQKFPEKVKTPLQVHLTADCMCQIYISVNLINTTYVIVWRSHDLRTEKALKNVSDVTVLSCDQVNNRSSESEPPPQPCFLFNNASCAPPPSSLYGTSGHLFLANPGAVRHVAPPTAADGVTMGYRVVASSPSPSLRCGDSPPHLLRIQQHQHCSGLRLPDRDTLCDQADIRVLTVHR